MSIRKINYPTPAVRRLQIFSLDPAADIELDTSAISRSTVAIPWEDVERGPVGEYLEVIDFDPSSECVYAPIDLSKTLASDGLDPSSGSPQFHQQMVYAVASLTISNFERILGRKVLWSERIKDHQGKYLSSFDKRRFVQRLRIYPHALRDQNAYYSPSKKALLFGYFNATTSDPREGLPGGVVFTCLSHDIIAHETTHAILDGIHRRLLQPSNRDMLAFHEAFSDIVAIFQHFTLPDLLLDQIQRTRGDLEHDNLLARLASEFARSTGRGNALRNAIGEVDANGYRRPPDPTRIGRTNQPHDRGAILVAAVYDAFYRIYENRVADLRRIATNGTGVLPEGDIHPDLAQRFAAEARRAANRVLTVCVRAIDYLPSVDINFGDYLRALITADADLVPHDPCRYRLAFIEAFRNHGIYPLDVRALSEDSLRWTKVTDEELELFKSHLPSPKVLKTMAFAYEGGKIDEKALELLIGDDDSYKWALSRGRFDKVEEMFLRALWQDENVSVEKPKIDAAGLADDDGGRLNAHFLSKAFAVFLRRWIKHKAKFINSQEIRLAQKLMGIDVFEKRHEGMHGFEVHAVRPTIRAVPDGRSKTQLIVLLTQKWFIPIKDENEQPMLDENGEPLTYKFRGGCTLIIDPEKGVVEYAISKNIHSMARMKRNQKFFRSQVRALGHLALARYELEAHSESGSNGRFEHLASIHCGAEGGEEY